MQCTRKFETLIVNEKKNHGICDFTKNVEKKIKKISASRQIQRNKHDLKFFMIFLHRFIREKCSFYSFLSI